MSVSELIEETPTRKNFQVSALKLLEEESRQEIKLKMISEREAEIKQQISETKLIYNKHMDRLRIPPEIRDKYYKKKSDIMIPSLELVFDPMLKGGIIRQI